MLNEMKRNQSPSGFELGSSLPFPMTITITARAHAHMHARDRLFLRTLFISSQVTIVTSVQTFDKKK